jgi:cell division protein FtsQ
VTAPVIDRPAVTRPNPPRARLRRRLLRLFVLLIAAGLAGAAVYAVWFSSLLAADDVRVVGVGGARADAILAEAAVPIGQPLARIDTQSAEQAVRTLPWVATADVRRGWPSEIVIAVTVRVPVAELVTPGQGITTAAGTGAREAVDADGVVFEPEGALPKGLPRVSAEGPALAAAVAVLQGLPADLARRVVSVTATTVDDVVLELRSGDEVRWGSADQAEFKAEVLRALLRRKADMYDVSAPEMPTIFRPGG